MRLIAIQLGLAASLVAGVAAASSAAPARDLDAAVTQCITAISHSASGKPPIAFDLAQKCPALHNAIEQHPLHESLLPGGARTNVSELKQLADLARDYTPATPQSHVALDTSTVNAIVEQVSKNELESEQKQSLSDRFWNWLGQWFNNRPESEMKWLKDFLDAFALPASTVRAVFYVVMVIVLAIAIAVVVNEVRRSGVLRRGIKRAVVDAPDAMAPTVALPTWDDINRLDPAPQLATTLKLVIHTQVRNGVLSDDPSRTNGFFLTQYARSNSPHLSLFEELVNAAEYVVFGGHTMDTERARDIVQRIASTDLARSTRTR